MGVSFYSVLEWEQWGSYQSLGRLNISRNYELFSALAFGDGGITDDMPYPPRGLPHDCSYDSLDLFFTHAEEVNKYMADSKSDDEEGITLEEYIEGFGDWAATVYETYRLLPAPETYDHSWLNLNELKEALAHRGLSVEKLAPDFRALLAAMHSLAEDFGPEKVRFVFGFGL
jgi:hypothetical protein